MEKREELERVQNIHVISTQLAFKTIHPTGVPRVAEE